jgi:hypothetical protein
VPVVAYASTAVPATMDGAGVLYDTKDPGDMAKLVDAVLIDAAIEQAVVASQDAALERLRRRDFAGTLTRFVDQILERRPRPAPEVAFDFWAQFDQFERLEELRQYRPALYKALPEEPLPSEALSAGRDPLSEERSEALAGGSEHEGLGDKTLRTAESGQRTASRRQP